MHRRGHAGGRTELPIRVPFPGLDLDNVGTKIRHDGGSGRAGEVGAYIEHLDAGQQHSLGHARLLKFFALACTSMHMSRD